MTSTVTALDTRMAEGAALQAVLLDMDGTLVDTEGIWWDAEVEVFGALGHRLDESWRDTVVGGPMTRSAGYLIEVTGADIALPELTTLLNDRFEARISGGVPLMPGALRLLTELAAHGVPTALVSASHRRIIDRVLTSLGPANFALTVMRRRGGADEAAPGSLPHRRGRPGRRSGPLCGHRGHRDRSGGGGGRRLPGGGRTLRGTDRRSGRTRSRRISGRSRPGLSQGTGQRNAPSRTLSVLTLF